MSYCHCESAFKCRYRQASISFLSPGKAGETLHADAREEASIGRAGVCTVHIYGDDGRCIAVFQGLSRSTGDPVIENEESEKDKT